MFQLTFIPELVSIAFGLLALIFPVISLAQNKYFSQSAAVSFFFTTLAVGFQLFLLSHLAKQDISAVEDTVNARFIAATLLILIVTVLNIAVRVRNRRHK